jgi:hypothetical protein
VPYFIDQKAIEKISADLQLPYDGTQQDWDIELADENRIKTFLEYAESNQLSAEEYFAIAALVISSYDDLLNNQSHDDTTWNSIKLFIVKRKEHYSDLLTYWGHHDIREGDFSISPLIRELL